MIQPLRTALSVVILPDKEKVTYGNKGTMIWFLILVGGWVTDSKSCPVIATMNSMISFRANTDKFNRSMRELAKHVNVSTSVFIKNEARLMAEELTKRFSPKMPKSKIGVEIDRRVAYKVKRKGLNQIPWARLQRAIHREKPSDRKPIIAAATAMPSQRKAIKALGTLAAGFMGRGNKLGAKARSFVTQHLPDAHGEVIIHNGPLTKWVRLKNFTPWLGEINGRVFLVKKAITTRTSAMRSNARKISEGVRTYMRGK